MAEYIEKGKAVDALVYGASIAAAQIVDALPTVDVAPVRHGRWKWLGPNMLYNGAYYGTCSVCGLRQSFTSTRFCGNCGAKMDLEDKP